MDVNQYLETKTNAFGMITEQELKFEFTYIDELGRPVTCNKFEDTEYGLTSVCVGEENKYVVKDFGVNVYRTLYVTEDNLENIYWGGRYKLMEIVNKIELICIIIQKNFQIPNDFKR